MDLEKQKEIFSKNLQKELAKTDKMQVEIAKALNVNLKTFNGWVHGVSTPRFNKMQELCEYLDIPMNALLEENYELTSDDKLKNYLSVLNEENKNKLLDRAEELYKFQKLEEKEN